MQGLMSHIGAYLVTKPADHLQHNTLLITRNRKEMLHVGKLVLCEKTFRSMRVGMGPFL